MLLGPLSKIEMVLCSCSVEIVIMIIFRDTHFLKRYHEKRIKNQQINGYDINNNEIEGRYGLNARVL